MYPYIYISRPYDASVEKKLMLRANKNNGLTKVSLELYENQWLNKIIKSVHSSIFYIKWLKSSMQEVEKPVRV